MIWKSYRLNCGPDRRSGQAIIFLLMVLVIGLLAVLWNFDLHNIVSRKSRIENAADAGALAAARWQGITLNMIGELNLIQAAILCEDTNNVAIAYEVSELRDRLALNGPILAYFAAQPTALLNLKDYDAGLISSELNLQSYYRQKAGTLQGSAGVYRGVPEPFDGAWSDYGNLLFALAQQDIVVECGNKDVIGEYDGWHFLFNGAFYTAVSRANWCWFEKNGYRNLLTAYSGYSYWDPLPPPKDEPAVNGEYFSTDVRRVETWLNLLVNDWEDEVEANYDVEFGTGEDSLSGQFSQHVEDDPVLADLSSSAFQKNWPVVQQMELRWHFYDDEKWMQRWPTADEGFPYRNDHTVRYEYDYVGADAVTRTRIPVHIVTPKMPVGDSDGQITDDSKEIIIETAAAAKAFGYLDFSNGFGDRQPPHFFGLVLPAFHDVRLISRGVSSEDDVDEPTEEHLYDHLPLYISGGIDAIREFNNCFYCRQLIRWEDANFRSGGEQWLLQNLDVCYPPPPPQLPPIGPWTPRPGSGGGGGADTSGSGGSQFRR